MKNFVYNELYIVIFIVFERKEFTILGHLRKCMSLYSVHHFYVHLHGNFLMFGIKDIWSEQYGN